jgi:L-ascorbate metabolism protein UlaG (beta-lactamase superfamily)
MKIQKFLHSCLLVEEKGKRILIDPSSWSFNPKASKIDDIPHVDALLITHQHQDHFTPDIIKQFIARDRCVVYANEEILKLMANQGITATQIAIPETINVGGVEVASVGCAHGKLPHTECLNNGFYINGRLFNPGDSHTFEPLLAAPPEILALPIMAPWGTFTAAVEIGLRLKPKHIIPVHDMVIAEDLASRLIKIAGDLFTKAGIEYHPLKPGEVFEV